ncbi:MAG: metallophosphoesterase [Sulfolobaceae archaeon]
MIELFIADLHLPIINEKAYSIMQTYLNNKSIKPDIIVLGGDIIDFESVSNYLHSPEKYNTQMELDLLEGFLAKLQATYLSAKIIYLEGNHERRLKNYILRHASALYQVVDLGERIKSYGIEYISNWDRMTEGKMPLKIGKLYHLHGHELKIGGYKNIAERVYYKTFSNTIAGHWHKTGEFFQRTLSAKIRGVWTVGCMSNTYVDYSPRTDWNNGFAIIDYLDNGFFQVSNLKIIENTVM